MVYTIDEIKEKVKPVAEKYSIPRIYLFGSHAKNEADETSDLDFAFDDTSSKVTDLLSLLQVENDLEKQFNKNVDLLTIYQLQNGKLPVAIQLYKNYNKEKVLVYEKT